MNRADRTALAAAVEDVQRWRHRAATARFLAYHCPVSGPIELDPIVEGLVAGIEGVNDDDLAEAQSLLDVSWWAARRLTPSPAAVRVVTFHAAQTSTNIDEILVSVRQALEKLMADERSDLATLVADVEDACALNRQNQAEAAHLPFAGATTNPIGIAVAGVNEVLETASAQGQGLARLVEGSSCSAGTCADLHANAAGLSLKLRELMDSDLPSSLRTVQESLPTMFAEQQQRCLAVIEDVHQWLEAARQADRLLRHLPVCDPTAITGSQDEAIQHMLASGVEKYLTAAESWSRTDCENGACDIGHSALQYLDAFHRQASEAGIYVAITAGIQRLHAIRNAQRREIDSALRDIREVIANADYLDGFVGPFLSDEPEVELTQVENEALRTATSLDQTILDGADKWTREQCSVSDCADLHHALADLLRVRHEWSTTDVQRLTHNAYQRFSAYNERQRRKLEAALNDISTWSAHASDIIDATNHISLTSTFNVAADDRELCVLLLKDAPECGVARDWLVSEQHDDEDSEGIAASIRACIQFHEGFVARAYPARLSSLHMQAETALAAERVELLALRSLAQTLNDEASLLADRCHDSEVGLTSRARFLQNQAQTVHVEGLRFRLFAFSRDDVNLATALRRQRAKRVATDAARVSDALLNQLPANFYENGKCTADNCRDIHQLLPQWRQQIDSLTDDLQTILSAEQAEVEPTFEDLLEHSLELGELLGFDLTGARWLPTETAMKIAELGTLLRKGPHALSAATDEATRAAEIVRHTATQQALCELDLAALKSASDGARLRLGPLAAHGLDTVGDVWLFDLRYELADLPGLSHYSAFDIRDAANAIYDEVYELTPVRLDPDEPLHRELLAALRRRDVLRAFDATDEQRTAILRTATAVAQYPHTGRVLVTAGATGDPSVLVDLLAEVTAEFPAAESGDSPHDPLWRDFLARPATYLGMLTELGFPTEDAKAMVGDLPADIVAAVRSTDLSTELLHCSLRTYQAFAAKFALVQEKVVIGDEMGLGKTVEALALFAHLAANGHHHFMVVCPAGLVTNWVRETARHTSIPVMAISGNRIERARARASWIRSGGVAVASYGTLGRLPRDGGPFAPAALVFDEAHYIKNPQARRTKEARHLIAAARRVVLMTGTPLENNVGEFRTLIGHVRPDLAANAPVFLPSQFRAHLAPAYLRRNQEDVLTELPELIEVDEWLNHSDGDERAYRQAVAQRNFMAMRRAGMLTSASAKMTRLCDIVAEAEANGRRVIVYSYFLDVLDAVAASLPGEVYGPLTGAVPPGARSDLIDAFGNSPGGAVLVAQITTGGVGLNIQSASVVVICEPQVKPTAESQAIARAHRMGQVHNVQVHRLLNVDSVDSRMREILDSKQDIIDTYARDSVLAEHAPEAVDVSEAELARSIIDAEQQRLFGHVTA